MQQVATAARADRLERMTNLVLVLLEASRPLSLREIASTAARSKTWRSNIGARLAFPILSLSTKS